MLLRAVFITVTRGRCRGCNRYIGVNRADSGIK